MDNVIPFPERPRMNLERAELLVFNYLAQAENPLVPVSALLEHCRRDEQCQEVDEPVLLGFLRAHEAIILVEGPGTSEAVGLDAFEAVGINMGPRAILKTRVPSANDMSAMMNAQLEDMEKPLKKARELAETDGDEKSVQEIDAVLARVAELRAKIEGMS